MKFKMNKRGWIRIMEAVVAILIMASVLIVIYTNSPEDQSYSDYVYAIQIRILDDVALSDYLRNETLHSSESSVSPTLIGNISTMIPSNFNFSVSVCSLNSASCLFKENIESEVFVEDRIISSNLTKYEPKMLRLFIWEKLS